MKINIIKISISVLLALSPLLYYEFREFLPVYSRRAEVYEIVFFVPYIFFGLTAFLGLKLNQSRIFFTALFWAILYYLINTSPVTGLHIELNDIQLAKLLAISALLVVFSIYALNEKYIMGLYGFLRLIFVVIAVVGSLWLAGQITPGKYPYLMEQALFSFKSWHLPELVFLFFISLVTFLILQKDSSIQKFKLALYVNLLPLILTFNFAAGRQEFDFETRIYSAFSFSVMGLVFLYALYRMYWEKVYIDELTGIPNRRAFDEYIKKLGRKYIIAMIDVDHFKKFNDTYGHSEGDNVLRFVAKHIAEECGGAAFRYGGEEFSVIYKAGQIKHAFILLDDMRENLASSTFFLRTSEDVRQSKTKKNRKVVTRAKGLSVTISVGISHKTSAKKEAQDVVDTADKALYKAKENGRNRCEKILS
jgi:diguanylate cyclase (GGDEF)-like protein